MIQQVISNRRTGEKLLSFEDGDFEMKNPIKQYGEETIVKQMILKGVSTKELNGEKEYSEKSEELFKNAFDFWIELKKGFQEIKIPENLIQLLKTDNKKEQQRLLKGLLLTPEILTSFFFTAYHEFGFTLSQYTSRVSPKSLDTIKKPLLYSIAENAKAEIFEKNSSNNAQWKEAIESSEVKIARIIDNGATWHCFFARFKNFKAEETWSGKKEIYFHHISNAFGIERAEIIDTFQNSL